jgi:hypothetical protein
MIKKVKRVDTMKFNIFAEKKTNNDRLMGDGSMFAWIH